jgi:hypothetical protein
MNTKTVLSILFSTYVHAGFVKVIKLLALRRYILEAPRSGFCPENGSHDWGFSWRL